MLLFYLVIGGSPSCFGFCFNEARAGLDKFLFKSIGCKRTSEADYLMGFGNNLTVDGYLCI
jgi:hypothetical protein